MGSFKDLFAPNKAYEYFQHADQYPFEVRSTYFSLVNAGWLADCALLAYLDEGDVIEALEHVGLRGQCFGFAQPGAHGSSAESGAQGFIAESDGWAIVCFRGTNDLRDVFDDLRIELVERDRHAGRVHEGFYESLESIWPGMLDELEEIQGGSNTPVPVWFTGHSLGAAMATLAADGYEHARALYTFGSPRVGDKAFRQGLAVNAYRIVNNNDVVTAVPPALPGRYGHVGDLKYFGDAGELTDDPRWWTTLKESVIGHVRALQDLVVDISALDLDELNADQIRDHSPTAYAKNLWNLIEP